MTGEGLKEATDAVEAIEAAMREADPARFTAAPRTTSGCLPGVRLLASATAMGAWVCA